MTDPAEQGARQAFAAFTAAMQAGDTDALRALVSREFTLTHITGYVQPGDEWLAEMQRGQFVYHGIDVQDIGVTTIGDKTHLVARTLTDARIYGGRNAWHLQLALDYARSGDRWIALCAVASVWS